MAIRPEDILPEEINSLVINGVNVRKATVGATLANANILNSDTASEAEKFSALEKIKELIPALIAIGLHQHVTWKNPQIQKLIDERIPKS